MKKLNLLVVVILSLVFLASCSKDENGVEFISVKLIDSDMWSIVKVEDGTTVYKDEFKTSPSQIVDGIFFVRNSDGMYDYYSVDDVNKPINKESYLSATYFNKDGFAIVTRVGQPISVINKKCEQVLEFPKDIERCYALDNSGRTVFQNSDELYGIMDMRGNIIIKPEWDHISNFSDGVAIAEKKVKDHKECVALDESGKKLFTFSTTKYKEYGSFMSGLLPVLVGDNKVEYLDNTGKSIGEFGKAEKYMGANNYYVTDDKVSTFYDGSLWGLKDLKGEIILRAKYDELIPFINNTFRAQKDGKYGVIDKEDKVIIPFEYENLFSINNKRIVVAKDKVMHIIDFEGKDVGNENYTDVNYIFFYELIESNYFNASKVAKKIVSLISSDKCGKATLTSTLNDFKDKVSGYKYSDLDNNYIIDNDGEFPISYVFDQNLTHRTYEYIYGYRISGTPEYSYNAKVLGCTMSYDVNKYDLTAEDKLATEVENLLKKKGFKDSEQPNILVSDKKTSAAVSYTKGIVYILYRFTESGLKPVREKRTEIKKPDSYYDADDELVAVDSVVVVEE